MGVLLRSAYVGDGMHDVPAATERFAIIAGARAGTRGIGWHADSTVVQAGETTFIGSGCTLRASSATTWRQGQPVRQALVRAGDAVVDYCRVDTSFDRAVACVAVVLEPIAGDGSAEDVEMVLTGARRPAGSIPRIVVAAGRTVAIYDVVHDEKTPVVDVEITVTDRVRLAGVMGAFENAEAFAERIAEEGVDRVLEPLARPSAPLHVRWAEGGRRRIRETRDA
jgi:hypothetical protein